MRFFATTLLQLTLTASVVLASPALSKQRPPVTTIPVKRADLSGYEYVVVGSGAGGGPVAARLATNGHKVLLIDAGDDQGANINEQVPAFHGLSTEDATMRWDYYVNHYQDPVRQAKDTKAVYQTSGGGQYVGLNPPAGAKLLGILYPRAGTLGGCGSHNALITVTPHDSDWNNIQSITGDSSWSASNMKQYFVRLEHVNYTPNSGVGHGTTGWFWTERADVQLALHDSKVVSQLIAAAAAMGQGLLTTLLSSLTNLANVLLTDMNSGLPGRDSREGLFQIPLARRDKARNGPRQFVVDTANAVNADGSKKYQLDIRLNCLVTKIIWDKSGSKPKAIGVEFLDGQSLYRADPRSGSASAGTPGSVNVTREVIISAGAFNTPQLLKLSGVGPQAELQKFNIPVVVNLPGVGTNLQDRYEIGVNSKVPTDFTILDGCTFNQGNDQCLQQWKSGQLSAYESTGFAQAILRRSSQAIGTDVDTFLFAGPHNFRGYYPNYEEDAVSDHRHWTWAILKGHTGNTAGTVALRSADPKDTPIINFNYFDTGTASAAGRDLNAVVEAVALARKINSNLPLLSETFTEVSPANNTNNLANLQEFVKNNAWGHHASCTCPIGADGDPNAVLDTNFQVRGTTGLRVVDASAFPRIPGLFLAVPLYMLAEKAADVIHAAASS